MGDELLVDCSKTSISSNTEGKECIYGRFISEVEGMKILEVADTWVGTSYALVGAKSEKMKKGDCSGTTNKIYNEAGFLYPYQRTSDFINFAKLTNRFREVKLPNQTMQAGDILWWPGHMAIYAPFPEGHPRYRTGATKGGRPIFNNMYTAFNSDKNTPYGPYNSEVFRGDRYRVFRYFIKNGEAGF